MINVLFIRTVVNLLLNSTTANNINNNRKLYWLFLDDQNMK